jgi:hypothetical protein
MTGVSHHTWLGRKISFHFLHMLWMALTPEIQHLNQAKANLNITSLLGNYDWFRNGHMTNRFPWTFVEPPQKEYSFFPKASVMRKDLDCCTISQPGDSWWKRNHYGKDNSK